ncbi:MAG: 3-dehydroquinate synthase, partial [Patescibacteria group bacterium]
KRNLTIISFGGGANQDIVGFVASTLYRGINWIYVPTTLLAMADSAIGLKTSLNFKNYKNVIGTFYPPKEIYINVDFLDTLSPLDWASGIGEIVKIHLMKDHAVRDLEKTIRVIDQLRKTKEKRLARRIIEESIRIKLSYMKGDEFDRGRRNLLNYGHELGHALESVSGFRIPHGTGVLIGMLFANYVSLKRRWLDKNLFTYINEKLLLPNIFARTGVLQKHYFAESTIIDRMKNDKKRTSEGLVLVLPKNDLTLIKINDLTKTEVSEGLKVVYDLITS